MPYDVLVYDALRTPRGKGRGGALQGVKPITLVAGLLRAVQERNPALDPSRIDDVVFGCVTPVHDQGADIARITVLAAGMPETVAGVQMNRFCASGLEAVNTAAQKIAVHRRLPGPDAGVRRAGPRAGLRVREPIRAAGIPAGTGLVTTDA